MVRTSDGESATAQPAREDTLRKRLLLGSLVLVITVVVGLALAEVLLRVLSIPGISYHTFYYDAATGGKHHPNSTLIYRGDRGDVVHRRINSWGFVDEEHDETPEPGVVRIGFFGDSYTEARQVALEDCFFSIVEEHLSARSAGTPRYEALAFGVSGRGTLQSYLEARQWAGRAHLDWVVYVFVENDPRNQLRATNHVDGAPYMMRRDDTFAIDSSFAGRYRHKEEWLHRRMQWLKSRSLVFSTIHGRIRLLMRRGIKVRVTEEDRDIGRSVNGPPSTWTSPELADEAWKSVEWVLERWSAEATTQARRFAVVNVPISSTLGAPLDEHDAWAPRLRDFCDRSGILYIDPSPELAAAAAAGQEIFYDHLTPDGHRAFAEAIAGAILRESSAGNGVSH